MEGIRLGTVFRGACLALAFLALEQNPIAQESPRTPGERLTKASNATDIQRADMPPFKMRARVRVLGDKDQPYEGTFEVLWTSPTQWREQLQLPGYSRLRVGGNGKIWLQRSIPFEIARSEQFDHLLMISSKLRLGPNEKVVKEEKKEENGVV